MSPPDPTRPAVTTNLAGVPSGPVVVVRTSPRGTLSPAVEAEDDDSSVLWIITYSDMITLLLSFFLLMYSFTVLGEKDQSELVQSLNVAATGGKVKQRALAKADLDKAAREIADRFAKPGQDKAWVDSTEKEVTIGLPSSVTFAVGEATLTPQATEALGEVARVLIAMPNVIRIEGHTDNLPIKTGAFPSNWHLSVARAQSMLRLLIDRGADPTRLQVVGYGDAHPRAPNDTDEGRAMNRRIEIKIVRATE